MRWLVVVAVLALPSVAGAHPWKGKDIGIGVTLGEPTGLTLEIRPNAWSAFDVAVGFGDFDDDRDNYVDDGYAHFEYLVRPFALTHKGNLKVPLYLGVGVFVADHGDWGGDNGLDVGARFPIGLAFELRAPVEIFFELAFRLALVQVDHPTPEHDRSDLGGAIGFRIYF